MSYTWDTVCVVESVLIQLFHIRKLNKTELQTGYIRVSSISEMVKDHILQKM